MSKKKKKIVITGAGGYVGSTLVEILKGEYNVLGFGHGLSAQAGAEIEGDIVNYEALSKAVRESFAVIHTASPNKESWCKEHPYEAFRSIVVGSRNVRRAADANNVPLVIHFSTQAVYSNFAKRPMPLRERMELIPDTFYGALKEQAEREFRGARSVILRPANIYGIGTGVLRGNVVHAFIKNALNRKPLVLNSGGKQKADFVHVRDVARAVKLILDARLRKGIFNIGSGKPTSVKEIAGIISSEMRRIKKEPPKIIRRVNRTETIAVDRWLSTTKAKKHFNWKSEISLEEGIKGLLDFYSSKF